MGREKMIKTASHLDKFMKALQIILIIGAGFTLIAGIALAMAGNSAAMQSDNVTETISFGALSISTVPGSPLGDAARLKSSMIISVISSEMIAAAVFYGICIFRRIIGPMKQGEPFIAGISVLFRRLAIVVLIVGTVGQIITKIASSITYGAYDLTKLLNMQVVQKYDLSYSLDLGYVVLAVILFLLAYVFRYGEELQREADETL